MSARHLLQLILFWSLFAGSLSAAEPAKGLLDQAKQAFQSGNREEAIRIATKMIEAEPNEPNNYYLRARFQELMGRREAALADYNRLLEKAPHATEVYYPRAVLQFLLGRIEASVADFDKLAEVQPNNVPNFWQRGIALYYAGRYEDGRKQFETHRTINAGDVENSAWHFLCVARQTSPTEARKQLLPVTGDSRVPMAEILELFAGQGSPEKVLARVESTRNDPVAQTGQRLYAHLYLALYHEALGQDGPRREHLQKAVDTNLKNEYMWEVARVHLELLKSGKLK